MVWTAIWWQDGESDSKRCDYTAKSYLAVFENQIPRIWEPGFVFMQDNVPIYTARVIRNWFEDQGIPVVDWPSYSPGLNPIEHVWWHLKLKSPGVAPRTYGYG